MYHYNLNKTSANSETHIYYLSERWVNFLGKFIHFSSTRLTNDIQPANEKYR